MASSQTPRHQCIETILENCTIVTIVHEGPRSKKVRGGGGFDSVLKQAELLNKVLFLKGLANN